MVEKTKSIFHGRSFNPQEFDKAVDSLLEILKSHSPNEEEKKAVFSLSEKLLEQTTEIKSHAQSYKTQTKISALVEEIFLQDWNRSGENMEKIVASSCLDDFFKTAIREDFIDKEEGRIFISQNCLRISPCLFEIKDRERDREKDLSVRRQLAHILKKYPTLTSIQVQGQLPIARSTIEELLKNPAIPVTFIFHPLVVRGPTSSFLLHPSFLLSSFFLPYFNFCERMGHVPEEIEWGLNFEVFSFLNQHVDDLNHLGINLKNVGSLLQIAIYLDLPQLYSKCQSYLNDVIREELVGLHPAQLIEWTHNWLSYHEIQGISLDHSPFLSLVSSAMELIINDKMAIEHAINFSQFAHTFYDRELFRKCAECVLDNFLPSAEGDFTDWLIELRNVEGFGPTFIRDFEEVLIEKWLSRSEGIDDCIEKIKFLKEKKIKVRSLNLSPLQASIRLSKRSTKDILIEIFELCPNLQALNLSKCAVEDDIGPYLAQLSQLQTLEHAKCNQLTDAIGPSLAKLAQLHSLNLSSCKKITNEIGPYLAQLSQLQTLELAKCNQLTDAIGPSLVTLTLKNHP